MNDVLTSKKFWAFIIGTIAVLLLVLMSVFLQTAVAVVASAIGSITSLVIAHMTGQASVDRAQANSPYSPDKLYGYAPGVQMPPSPSTTVTTTTTQETANSTIASSPKIP